MEELKKTYGDKKVIVGVDRLDYIKGIPQKLRGLEEFFERFPEWVGKVNDSCTASLKHYY